MAADKGRDFLLAIEDSAGGGTYTTIADCTEHSFTITNSEEDITNKSSAGNRALLPESGVSSISIDLSGILTKDTQQELLLTNARTKTLYNYQLTFGDDDSTLTGAFQVVSYSSTGGTTGAQTFTATLQSSGAVTYVDN